MRQKIGAGSTRDSSRRYVRTSALFVLITLASPFGLAAPSGGEVTAGSGSINQTGSAVTIDQSSSRLAINWQRFDIGAGESVTFNQPSAQAIALNRILGQDPSVILGSLSANGQVFLLNPNGVLFGAGARVDVGGIVASTLSLSNDDFLAGHYTFAGSGSNSVVNRGTIDAAPGGYVAFIGPSVANEGVIRAGGGTVALGAGDQVTLNIAGDQLVGFSVDKAALGALAANRQLIQADGGTVILSAQAKDALVSSVVNNDGIIEARSVSSANGVIRLDGGSSGVVTVAGTLDASGTTAGEVGGRITVTGDKVALLDGAHIDASGASGGGTVLIGGGYQGSDPDVHNATRTFVGPSAEVSADALDVGDGGRVIVWADGDTRFHGSISAQGGSAGGDGGFVEVSGKQQLGFDGRVDTSAAGGVVGTLLLDPNDLYIAAAPVGGALADATNPFQSNDGVNDYYVLGTTLTALPVNTAVQLQANRDIIFQTSLAMPTTAAGSLTLTAVNGIQMAGFDLSTANAGVSMTAGAGGISNLGTINLGTGALTLNSSGAITQNAGDAIQGSGAVIKQGTGTLTLSGGNTYGGVTTISAGTVSVTNAGGLGAVTAGTTVASGATLSLENVAIGTEGLTINGTGVGGNGVLIASGTAASSGTVAMASASTVGIATGTDTLSLLGVVSGGFALTKIGAGTLISSGNNTYTGGTVINAGTLAVTANNALGTSAGGTTIASGATLDLRNVAYGTTEPLTVNGGTIAATSGTSSFAGAIALGGNSTINVTGTQLTLAGVTSGAFGLDKQSSGTLVLSGANTYTGATNVSAGTLRLGAASRIADTSAVTVASGATFDLNSFSETVGSLAGAGNVTLGTATLTAGGNASSTTFSGVLSGTGGLTKAGVGAMTLTGTNTYTGVTTINGGVLRASGGNAIADASQVTLANAAGASLDLTNDEAIGNLSGGGTTGGGITLNGNTLTINEAGTTTFAGVASGTGGLIKQGAGALTLSGANTYSGQTAINAGTVAAGASNVFADTTNLVVNGAVLSMTTRSDTVAGVQLLSGSITGTSGVLTSTSDFDLQSGTVTAALGGAVALNKSPGGTVLLSGANTYTGATNVNAGTLRLGAASRIADTSAVTVASGATFDLNNFAEAVGSLAGAGGVTLGTGTLTAGADGSSTAFSGAVTGTGGLTKVGTGVLTLSGTNAYSGATTINGGVLRASGGSAIADASQVTLANTAGASLDLTNDEAIGNLSGGGTTGGNVTLNGNSLTVNEAGTTTFSGIASGTGGLTKLGVGSLTLSGLNTYSGVTAVTAGTLALGGNNALSNGTQVVVNGGTLAMTTRSDTVAGVQMLSGSITGTSGVLTSTSDFDLQSGTVTAALGGAVALNKSTGGTVLLSGANTYTGATNVSAGTLRLGAASRIADTSAVTVASGATFDLNSFSETVGSLAGAGNVTLGTATLTAGGNASSTTFSGVLSGTGGLTKAGVGAMTLTGTNTYTGVTTINGGVLRASGGNAIADASQVTLANAAGASLDLTNDEAIGNLSGGGTTGGGITLNGNTLTINEAGTTTFAGVASGTGGLIKQGAGALTLSGANTFAGPVNINAGTLALSGGSALVDTSVVNLGTGTLQISSAETVGRINGANGTALALGATLTFGDAVDSTVASTISGTGALTKRGTSSVTLTGANTYSGATTINAGTLIAANSTALGTTAAGTTVANGGQLQIAGVNVGAETVALNGSSANGLGALIGTGNAALAGAVTLASASTIGAPNPGNSLTLSGPVNGARALTQTGAGTVAFAGAVGSTTALTSFTSTPGSTTAVNGGLLRTTGTQVYDGTLITGAATTLQTTNSAITANGSVTAPGTLTFATGTGGVSMLNPLNDFGTVNVTSAGLVNLIDANSITLGNATAASLRAQTLAGDVTLTGILTASGGGDAIVLASGGNFFNNAGPSALNAPSGRWLVWSADPAVGGRGGLVSAFKQYNANVGVTPIAGVGNGFLYSVAPFVTTTLVGSVTRVYDGTAVAALLPSNYATSGAIDGDNVTLNNPASGTFDDRNVGTGKNVSVSGLAIANASNGPTTVYGYQLASTTANANIGTITPAAVTLTATTNSKAYDGTTAAAALPAVTGLMGGDSISGLSESYADKNVGTGKTLSVASYMVNDGNGGNNYTVGLIDNLTGVIDPAALIGSFAASNKVYDATNTATITGRSLTGVVGGDDVSYVGGTATFSDRNAGVGKTVTASGLGLGGADSANYTVNSTASTTASITPAPLTIAATTNVKTYDGTVSAAAAPTITGLVGGDTAGGVSEAYADKNAGTGKTLSVAGYTINDGNGGNNYTVGLVDDMTGVIDRAALIGSIAVANKVYDGDPTAVVTSRALTGVVSGDAVMYVGGTATFADRNVGLGKTVTGSGLSLTGSDAGNYTVNAIATTLADITPATLTYMATPVRIAVNTSFPTFGGTVAGFAGTDTQASATSGTLLFATSAPDSNQIGAYAVDGSGLSANFGNYVFAQDPANATALVITPRADPAPSGSGLEGLVGAIASALQTQDPCTGIQEADGQAMCGAQESIGAARHVDNAAFTREGAGIRLPAGVPVQ